VTALIPSPTVVVAQLVPLQESSLALAGTLLITALASSAGEVHPGAVEPEAEVAAALSGSSAVPLTVGQGVPAQGLGGEADGGGDEPAAERDGLAAGAPAPATGPSWQRLILGTEEALERFNRQHPELFPAGRDDGGETRPTGRQSQGPAPTQPVMPPGQSPSPSAASRLEAIDRAIELRYGPDEVALGRSSEGERPVAVPLRWSGVGPELNAQRTIAHRPHRPGTAGVPVQQIQESGRAPTVPDAERQFGLSCSLALAATVAGAIGADAVDRRAGKRTLPTAPRGWPTPRRGGRDARAQGG
jgi:hypothetical protein